MPIFQINKNSLKSVKAKDFSNEKALQSLVENNLEVIFNCRFIATEFSTGSEHGGRIDTLALSEDNNPVIIEYKIKESSDLINQGLFYLHWLNDHKGDFITAANKVLGYDKVDIDWSYIRVICIAPRFKKYDLLAVKTMGVNIELWQYKMYENNCFSLEEVFKKEAAITTEKPVKKTPSLKKEQLNNTYTFEEHSVKAKENLKDILNNMREFILSLDSSVSENPKKQYIAYTSTQNFACLVIQRSDILVYLKINPDEIKPLPSNTQDVRGIGHWGTGDLRLVVSTPAHLEEAKKFIQMSFNNVGG